MVEIDNNNRADREEERQLDKKKAKNRRDLERKMKYEPMKTFEAKLSEKTAHEMDSKNSALRDAHDNNKTKEEKESFLNKVLGAVKDKSKGQEAEKSRVNEVREQLDDEFGRKDDKDLSDKEFKVDEQKEESTETADNVEKEQGEVSKEGHKRVAEKDGEGGSGGSGGGSDSSGDESSGGDGMEFGSQSDGSNKKSGTKTVKGSKFDRVAATKGISSGGSGGFNSQARSFTPKNLDEMVEQVTLGINEFGEEEFAVELSDEYFDGLKVVATRTDEGVVLKFECSSVDSRSTFLKYRPKVYAHFKKKGIKVKRIDVV